MSIKPNSMSLLHYSSFQRSIDCLPATEVHYRGEGVWFWAPCVCPWGSQQNTNGFRLRHMREKICKETFKLPSAASGKTIRKKRLQQKIEQLWMSQWRGVGVFPQLCSIRREDIPMRECEMWSVFHEAICQTKSCDKAMPLDQTNVWVFAVA